jgi:hypothetical protein
MRVLCVRRLDDGYFFIYLSGRNLKKTDHIRSLGEYRRISFFGAATERQYSSERIDSTGPRTGLPTNPPRIGNRPEMWRF